MANAAATTDPGWKPISWQRPFGIWVILAAIAMFVLLATFATWHQNDRHAKAEFQHKVERYQSAVERNLAAYQTTARSLAVALGSAGPQVTRDRFDQLARAATGNGALGPLGAIALLERLDAKQQPPWLGKLELEYPELRGAVRQSDAAVDAATEATGNPLMIRHRWPEWTVRGGIGRRLSGAEHTASALESGAKGLLSLGPLFLADTLDGPHPAYVLLAPVATAAAAAQPPEASSAAAGLGSATSDHWISVLLLADSLFALPLETGESGLAVYVIDVDAPDAQRQVVFDSVSGDRVAPRFSETRRLSALGRTWLVTYDTTPVFHNVHRDTASMFIATGGALMASAVLVAFIGLGRARRTAINLQARSETRFEQINKALPIGVFETDAAGRCTFVNDTLSRMTGKRSARLLGRGPLRSVPRSDRRWLIDQWRERRADDTPFRLEHPLRGADNAKSWVLTEIVRQVDAEGALTGYVGTCVDINARRAFDLDLLAVQQRAIAAEARMLAAIDAMDSGFALYGPDNRLVTVNARLRSLFGHHADEIKHGLTRENVLTLLHRSLVAAADPEVEAAWVQARAGRSSQTMGEVEEYLGGRWFRVAHRRTSNGDTITLRSEITAEKLREIELQRLATVASQTIDGVAILDPQGRIEWVNAAYERLTGYALDEVRGRRGREFLIGPLTDKPVTQEILSSYETAAPFRVETRHYTKAGDPVWFQVRSQPLRDGAGLLTGFVQTRFDIGNRKAAEAAAAVALEHQRLAERRLRESIDAFDAAFSLYDENECLVVSNQNYLELIGRGDTGDGHGSGACPAQPAALVSQGLSKQLLLRKIYLRHIGSTGIDPLGRQGMAAMEAWVAARLADFRAAAGSSEGRIGERWYRTTHRRTPMGDTVVLRIDITAARDREEDHRRLAMIARETNDGVAILDTEARAVWVNAAFERLTGYTFDEIRGRRGRDYLSGPHTSKLALDRIAQCMIALLPCHVEVLNYRKDGEARWWDLRVQPLFDDDGQHIGYFQTRFDITGRRTAEAAALRALSEQRRAETRLLQAIESLDEAFALYDSDERLIIFNEGNRRLAGAAADRIRVGMTRTEVIGVIAENLYPDAADTPARNDFIEHRLAEHRAGNLQIERRIGDSWHRVSQRTTPLGDVVSIRTDISAARAREAELEKLSMVASRTANAVMIIDAQERVEWVNESFERSTGFSLAEAAGQTPRRLLTGPLTDQALSSEIRQMVERGLGMQVELINYRKDGQPFWASIERQPIRDESGRIVRWIRLSLDISERKRAELALRASEARNALLAAVVQQTTAAVITKDLDNLITTWNRGAEQLYGYTAAQAIGQPSHEFLNPGITDERGAALLAGVRGGSAETRRLQHRCADGSWIDIEAAHGPQHDDAGELVGRITVIRDVTDQMRARRSIETARAAAEQAQHAMATFLSNMSHELRTPMHAILSYARLGQDRISRGTPEKTLQYLDRIEQSGDRLLVLLNDLLDLSRLEAGRMPIDPSHHDMRLAVDAAISEVGALAQSCRLKLETSGPRALLAWFDPARIAQVLANVLGNALKFSPPDGIIGVRLARVAADDGRPMVEVRVSDNGIGIPDGEREQIFDKFVQSSKTRTGAGGTGLGLAISRELVNAHGGLICARENPAGGTLVIFTVPEFAPSTAFESPSSRGAATQGDPAQSGDSSDSKAA